MPYTVWSRNRLIGESELAFARSLPGLRAGHFTPSALGEQLMPIITGSGQALRALYDVSEDIRRERPEGEQSGHWPTSVRRTTEYADALSINDELESLDLELRDPGGAVVKTEWIAIQDTHRWLAASDPDEEEYDDVELTEDEQNAVDHDREIIEEHFASLESEPDDEPWVPDDDPRGPRYQIMVALEGFDTRMIQQAEETERSG